MAALGSGLARGDDTMALSSSAFKDGEAIPPRFAKTAENLSPPLIITGVPAEAQSLALIVDDPDAPAGTWVHWLVWNLPPDTKEIPSGKLPAGAVQGKNSWGHARWDGPAPPSGTHRYVVTLYALKTSLALPAGAERGEFERAMQGKVLATCRLTGNFAAAK
jgi:Raf kinase inhibitor-like YbhB/YbcL family protein